MTKPYGSIGLQFENWVRQALKRIGFKDVAGGPDFKVAGHQIDACGGWDDLLLIVECTQSTTDSASVHELISEVKGKQAPIKKGFRNQEAYTNYKRCEFAIVTRNIKCTDGDRKIASDKPRVHLIDFQTIEYYQRLASLIGQKAALFNLLGEVEIEPRDFTLPRLPAFRVQLGKSLVGYLFWCDPHELLKVAYVARRESGQAQYYQRMLTAPRLNKIKEFIQHGEVFPNNIIVAFDHTPQFRPKGAYEGEWPSWLEFGELVFPKSYRSCWVIDGQHRLYAFGRVTPNPSTQKVAVFAFHSLSKPSQAKFFIQINHEQKPVSPDLIWDLEGEMSPQTPRGQIAQCVKVLNSTLPLKDKVFLPLSGKRERGQLKMSGICQDINDLGLTRERTDHMIQSQRNPFVHGVNLNLVPGKVGSGIADFLTKVRSETQACSKEFLWGGILLRPGGITIALNVYEQIITRVGQTPSLQQLEEYAKVFVDMLADLAPAQSEVPKLVREQLTSYAQRRQVVKEILAGMQDKLKDPDFAKAGVEASKPLSERFAQFERRFAEFVTERLGVYSIQDLKQVTPEVTWKRVTERFEQQKKKYPNLVLHQALTLGEVKEILERSDNQKVLMPVFTDPVNGFGNDQAVLAGLTGIIEARNSIDHGRRMGNRRLVMAYLETFERLIGS